MFVHPESQLLALQEKQALLLSLAVQMRKRSLNVHNYVQQGSFSLSVPVWQASPNSVNVIKEDDSFYGF